MSTSKWEDVLTQVVTSNVNGLLNRTAQDKANEFLCTGTTSTAVDTPVTFERLQEMARVMDQHRRSEPIFALMVQRGYDPDDGWVLVIPSGVLSEGYPLPAYVKESAWSVQPFFVRDGQYSYEAGMTW